MCSRIVGCLCAAGSFARRRTPGPQAKLRLLAEFCRAGYPELSTLPGVAPAVQRALAAAESLDQLPQPTPF